VARILIVEDNPDLLMVLDTLLSAEHEVLTARRGEEAIALVRSSKPDGVILDLQLPCMDGVEAGLWMKREAEPEPLPILVLTALVSEAEEVLASGCCDDFLAKPASLDQIRERMSKLLGMRPRVA
jgi:DNA-binding response OmpR family regulator